MSKRICPALHLTGPVPPPLLGWFGLSRRLSVKDTMERYVWFVMGSRFPIFLSKRLTAKCTKEFCINKTYRNKHADIFYPWWSYLEEFFKASPPFDVTEESLNTIFAPSLFMSKVWFQANFIYEPNIEYKNHPNSPTLQSPYFYKRAFFLIIVDISIQFFCT